MSEPDEQWDLVLKPRRGWFRFNLHEVWNYRDLLWLFVKRDFIAQYKQTVLGPVWHVVQPILTALMFLLIFGRIANIPTDGVHPVLFYLSGIALWNYFSACLANTSNTFVANAAIFGKVYFPRIIIPLSIVISNLIRFGVQFLLVVIVIAWYYYQGHAWHPTPYLLLIPLILCIIAALGLGLGILVSSITTKYRDFAVLLSFVVQLGLYATPVVYPLSYLANSRFYKFIQANPLSPLVEAFRFALFEAGTWSPHTLAYSALFTGVVLFAGLLLFNRVESTFMDTV